jgi:hypothetical protein
MRLTLFQNLAIHCKFALLILRNIHMYTLIIITYLGGSAWGPQVSMQEFSSKNSCASARTLVMKMTDEMNKTNLAGGTSRREIISAECIKK